METTRIALSVMLLLTVAGIYAFLQWKRRSAEKHEYHRRRPLNTYEQAMYWRLVNMLPQHVILAQVAMNRCIATQGKSSDLFANQHLDFVVCTKSMKVVAAIEIADESRPASDYRKKMDELKEEALEMAGIRLLKCSSRSLLTEAYIAMEFNNHSSLMFTRIAA